MDEDFEAGISYETWLRGANSDLPTSDELVEFSAVVGDEILRLHVVDPFLLCVGQEGSMTDSLDDVKPPARWHVIRDELRVRRSTEHPVAI